MAKYNTIKTCRSVLLFPVLVASIFVGSVNLALASGLNASVSTGKVALGDSFTLQLSNENGDRSPPDLSPLQQDFQILGRSQSSRTSIINGVRSDNFSWLITLAPRIKGRVTIPPLTAGNLTSNPVAIEVLDAAAMPSASSSVGNVSIDARLEPGSYYVHQEIPLTVTISESAGARELQLSEPTGSDFLLKQSGEDQVYQVEKNGTVANVIERKYLLKLQKSGTVTIPPLVLRARVSDPNARRSPFGSGAFSGSFGGFGLPSSFFDDIFDAGRQLVVSSKPLVIEVKSRPTSDGNWFLPADDVQLNASWEPTKPEFRVGEAATRIVRLLALGASQEQLPDIQLTTAEGARVYIDSTDSKTVDTPSGTVAMREYVLSVVPTGAEKINLQSIEVKWWDTEADVARVATLPAETYQVEGGVLAPTPALSTPVDDKDVDGVADKPEAKNTAGDPAQFDWLAAALAAAVSMVAIGTVLIVMGRRKRERDGSPAQGPNGVASQPQSDPSGSDQQRKIARAYRDLETACKRDDVNTAYSACIAWLRLVYGDGILTSSRLEKIAPLLAQELAGMERAIYDKSDINPWHGESLLKAVTAQRHPATSGKSRTASARTLAPLYPPVVES